MGALTKSITVVLADDNIDLTSALRKLFEFEPDIECVGCVADARAVIQEVSRSNPRVLVIDLSLPGGDSAAIIRELRTIAPDVRAIVFSGFQDDDRIERTIDAGAWQFVLKDTGVHRLVDAIRSVASDAAPASAAAR